MADATRRAAFSSWRPVRASSTLRSACHRVTALHALRASATFHCRSSRKSLESHSISSSR